MNLVESIKRLIKNWEMEEWEAWHKENGHDYYERNPKVMAHLKNLTRLDAYILMRIRSGADKREHEECKNYKFRHHLAPCDRFNKERPELHTLYDDKKINEWVTWWTANEYLNMNIPTNTESHHDVQIIYGNPFDSTIMMEKDGKTIVEKVNKNGYNRCGRNHEGQCQIKAKTMRGRWFFIDQEKMECEMCGGKFGGESTSRPGGSGLINHFKNRKDSCGRKWEVEYWKREVLKWDEWDEELQAGLVIKWIELY